ncbi:MAG: T9SS type A sorting domain-containing protein [Bacteroidetes bacterium]|nr:T9SS type A sorting domain-containing protein [Bacteroidota bacterium]
MKNIYALSCAIAVAISPILAQQGSVNVPKDFIRSTTPNVLNMHVAGGDYGYQDNLYIYYWEGATTGYDEEFESIKWYSINDDATMIWSIASDETELAINAMPLHCLYSGLTSIPIHFQCGYDEQYTLTFSGMDDFEYPTEFWLEDLCTDDGWFSINRDSDTYTFSGCVNDSTINRFVMHFMDPTGIETNPFNTNPVYEVQIYASANSVIIETEHPELIRGVEIFDLVGNEIYAGHPDIQNLNKIYVSSQHGYYFVKVITNSHIFTKKIFIGK